MLNDQLLLHDCEFIIIIITIIDIGNMSFSFGIFSFNSIEFWFLTSARLYYSQYEIIIFFIQIQTHFLWKSNMTQA